MSFEGTWNNVDKGSCFVDLGTSLLEVATLNQNISDQICSHNAHRCCDELCALTSSKEQVCGHVSVRAIHASLNPSGFNTRDLRKETQLNGDEYLGVLGQEKKVKSSAWETCDKTTFFPWSHQPFESSAIWQRDIQHRTQRFWAAPVAFKPQ